jgi:hypothetical protein
MKYVIYATDEHGDGYVQEIGRFDSLSDIEIRTGHFAPDVVITVVVEDDEYDDDGEDIEDEETDITQPLIPPDESITEKYIEA